MKRKHSTPGWKRTKLNVCDYNCEVFLYSFSTQLREVLGLRKVGKARRITDEEGANNRPNKMNQYKILVPMTTA